MQMNNIDPTMVDQMMSTMPPPEQMTENNWFDLQQMLGVDDIAMQELRGIVEQYGSAMAGGMSGGGNGTAGSDGGVMM